ncbi:MAG TPA: ABC transporter ATP-binding protein [Steroidobacter sp.]|uniref:ABC transporter ATP-binding protein n=1 Tax=Steroidobacter sp. TaxID=1978227 RepID=UPI002ED8C602
MSGIRLDRISKTFGAQRVIDDVSVEVAPHEFVTLLGPSGCGKSTLLNIAAGLERPTDGRVLIGGRNVTDMSARERNVAMVFQSYALYPHMSVAQNLAFPLRIQRLPRAEIDRRVKAIAETIELGALLDRKPAQLSGGQRQRVAIGRAIIRSPSICLLDEPLSNIDAALRVRMRSELKLLFNKMGTTIMFVTHDQVEAMTLSDRIIVLHGGKVQQQGTPLEIYRNPANAFVARFIGSPQMNILPAIIDTSAVVRAQALALPLTRYAGAAGPVQLGLRPEDVQLGRFENCASVHATVTLVEHLGHGAIVHYTIEGLPPIIGLETRDSSIRAGWRGNIHINLDGVKLFDAASGLALRGPQRAAGPDLEVIG